MYIFLLIPHSLNAQNPATEAVFEGFDAYMIGGIEEWEVPGLAVAIVKNDQILLARGYGVREFGLDNPVTPDTIFPIASLTKAFTATALGILVDDGKMSWTDPITKYLPDFAFSDSCATKQVNFIDLLSHRTGLSFDNNSLLWPVFGFSQSDILQKVRYFSFSHPFRTYFEYSNVMYVTAGAVFPSVNGSSWKQVMQSRILDPLQMKNTYLGTSNFSFDANLAKPHVIIDGQLVAIPLEDVSNMLPAAGMSASVNDLANWLKMNLAGGTFSGKQIISSANLKAIQTPHSIFRADGFFRAQRAEFEKVLFPGSNFISYGLGWCISLHHGHVLMLHPGKTKGMSCIIGMVPEINLGIVLLSNLDESPLVYLIFQRLVDLFLDIPHPDRSEQFHEIYQQMNQAITASQTAPAVAIPPSLPLPSYIGNYSNQAFGTFTVAATSDQQLSLQWGGNAIGNLNNWQKNVFKFKPNENVGFEPTLITFRLNPQGQILGFDYPELGFFERVP